MAAISATSASKRGIEAIFAGVSAPWLCTTQPMSPGRGSRNSRGVGARAGAEQPLDGCHGRGETPPVGFRQRTQHLGDVFVRTAIELCEGLTPLGGQAELILPPICRQAACG